MRGALVCERELLYDRFSGFNTMKPLIYRCLFITIAFIIGACAVKGDVVKVTTIKEGAYAGLKKDDLAQLNKIKKAKSDEGINENLKSVIEESKPFSVAQYLSKHPDKKGPTAGDYRVGGYDVLSITVYEERDLSRKIRVSAEGFISFPLIGRIKVDNCTTSEIERIISYKLAEEQYLLDAHVSVMVVGYNSKRFLVLGAVKKPGSYSLQAKERVLDAISKAGGITRSEAYHEEAGKKGVVIRTENPNTYNERKVVINFDLQGLLNGSNHMANIYMADKDVLFIPKAEHFYIIGQVRRPGSYSITGKEITLVEAIGMAGGFTRIAARNKTRIIRVEDGTEKIINVKVDAITKAGKKIQDVIIQPDDVIVVPESFF